MKKGTKNFFIIAGIVILFIVVNNNFVNNNQSIINFDSFNQNMGSGNQIISLVTSTVKPSNYLNFVSGQTSCWDKDGVLISCAGTGQDADIHLSGVRTYTDNGNDTVTDSTSNLMWQKTPTVGVMSWQEALDYCNASTLAGYTDWYLPNYFEVPLIIDYERNSYIYSVFGEDVTLPYIWTSTTGVDVTTAGYYYQADYTTATQKFKGHEYYGGGLSVMCVRQISSNLNFVSGQTSCYDENGTTISCSGTGQDADIHTVARILVNNGDEGTVTDNTSNVMWMRGYSDTTLDWQESLDYCNNLTLAGYSDWYLPNILESFLIMNYENNYYVYPEFGDSVRPKPMWSSTTSSGRTTAMVFYDIDYIVYAAKSKLDVAYTDEYYAKCIRRII